MNLFLIDSHSHLQFSDFDNDRQEVLARMREKNIKTIVIGDNYQTSLAAINLAEQEGFYAGVGLHPIHVQGENDSSQDSIPAESFNAGDFSELFKNPRVVGIGECGLDYYHNGENNKEEQKEVFQKQIKLAQDFKKPLILHIRAKDNFDAYQDALDLLKDNNYQGEKAGVVHFFSANWEIAKKFLDLGFYLSFSGVITFTHQYDEVIKNAPLEKILVETDCPYATPEPFRGKRNESTFVEYVAKKIAELKNIPIEKVAEITTKNCIELFGLVKI
ncbi:MAG TPA: TatD family hydrolase [Candidatus Paceibacterota bacterium]|nr:TatD family hydrolase [Candidatus Paceibacterota bacterium]